MLAIFCVLMLGSSDESEGEVPSFCIRQLGAARIDPARNGLPLDSDDDVDETPCAPNWDRSNTTGRGQHSHESAAVKLTHADQAHAAWEVVQSSALAGACGAGCTFGCEDCLQRNEMFTCLESCYETIAWVSADALKVLKRQATISYGKEGVRDGEAGPCSVCGRSAALPLTLASATHGLQAQGYTAHSGDT